MRKLCIPYFFHHNSLPPIGSKIKITWLPYNNAWPNKNVYIGSEGIVKEHYLGGGFGLWLGGAWLIVHERYRYKYL